jgi:hypothetical protein
MPKLKVRPKDQYPLKLIKIMPLSILTFQDIMFVQNVKNTGENIQALACNFCSKTKMRIHNMVGWYTKRLCAVIRVLPS